MRRLTIWSIPVDGEIRPGDNLGDLLGQTGELADGDVVCVSQKAVSKAEGRVIQSDAEHLEEAFEAALAQETRRVLRVRGTTRIVETHHGFVCANAGIDRSNAPRHTLVLLPEDPDRSARRIRDRLRFAWNLHVGVIVTDTFGRAWREGVTDVAIGVAGVRAILDLRGTTDWTGATLRVTEVCIADEIAAAANLVATKAAGTPFSVVRGVDPSWLAESAGRDICRDSARDLFR